MPVLTSRLAGWAHVFRRQGERLAAGGHGRKVLLGVTAALLVLVAVVLATRPNAVAVELEGQVLGAAKSEAVVQTVVAELEAELAAQGWVQPQNHRPLGIRPVRVARAAILTPDQLRERLRQVLAFNVRAAGITVNGKVVAWVKDQATAEAVLARVKEAYLAGSGKVLEAKTEETVGIQEAQVKTSQVVSPEAAVHLLREGTLQSTRYTVAPGDSLWSIARAHGTTVEELRAANPQLQGDRLQIGDELRLVRSEAPVHYLVTREIQVEEAIPYPVEIRSDGTLYRGQEKVKQEGQPGVRVVTYRVVERNGVALTRSEVGREVVREPVAKIVARGTKRIVVASRGEAAGVLSWPVYGEITSGYGYRGREFHAALDIGSPLGAPVRAAAAGTVIFAGYDGGYGRTVLIDHGGGLLTRYAHLSSIAVEVGENVERGERIGGVGQSGRATGPHLHFEVLVDGVPRNPLNYLR
ncbi:MAG: peptidoglycan DD-metalloendopeptidase family protein [Moorellales bacterium]